jgi:hypothetical protein
MEKVTFIKGETYLFYGCGVSAQFHSIFKPVTIHKQIDSSLIEYRFVNAKPNRLVNSVGAISIKNYKERYLNGPLILFNPENGNYQPLLVEPLSLRNLKLDRKNKSIQLQKFAFHHSLIGYQDMLSYQSQSLFKQYLGPRLPSGIKV